jgi:hypothetical protein
MAGPDDNKFTGGAPVDASTPGVTSVGGPGDRFAQPDDKIHAIPGVLIDNKIKPGDTPTLGDNQLFEPTARVKSGMEEGMAFDAKDKDASKWLTTFLRDADTGFRVYHATARSEGHDYINSDQVGASFFQNVDDKKGPESYFSKNVTSDIYA